MKHLFFSFRFVLLTALLLGSDSYATAYDLAAEGIYYNLNGESASVAGINSGEFSNTEVFIPQTITSGGILYPVTSINAQAFYNQNWITSITIPNTITNMGEKAFYGCSGLTRVNISDLAAWCKIEFNYLVDGFMNWGDGSGDNSPFYYGGNPLREAHHLYLNGEEVIDLVIPASVDSVSFGAFRGCSYLRSVDTGSGAIFIGGQAFRDCTSLTDLTIGESMNNMGSSYSYWDWKWPASWFSSAFPYHIDRVIYKAKSCDPGFSSYGYADGTSFDELIIDEGVEVLHNGFSISNTIYYNAKNCVSSDYPFLYCTNLKRIFIGNQVETIGGNIFYIEGLSIELDTITCYATIPPVINTDCFSETTYDRAVLCVPENSLQAYRNATGWEEFWRIVAFTVDSMPGDVNGDGSVNISDVTALIDYLLGINTGINQANADVNNDGSITITDVTVLIDYLLFGSW